MTDKWLGVLVPHRKYHPFDIPMQTQGVQERRKTFHENENTNGQNTPESENGPQQDATEPAFLSETIFQNHVPQDFS